MKAILVIDIADDVAKNYNVLTVDYTLRGDNDKAYDWIDYVQDVELKVLPQKKRSTVGIFMDTQAVERGYELGWNACLDEITGEIG